MLYSLSGNPIEPGDISFVDNLVALKRKSGSNPWPVIEKIIQYWESKKPDQWKSYLVEVRDVRSTRKDPKFASSTDKVTGGILRYTLDIPMFVMKAIRCVYSADELDMSSREFTQAWARKFPRMKIAEKL